MFILKETYLIFCSVIGCGCGAGSEVGQLLASDRDEEGTSNAMLMYTIETVLPVNGAFSLDAVSGRILTRDMLRRRDSKQYTLMVNVSDQGNRHTRTHTLTHDAYAHTQAGACTHTNAQNTHTHEDTHTHTHTHTHSHTHLNADALAVCVEMCVPSPPQCSAPCVRSS